jgi:hypothetical protein
LFSIQHIEELKARATELKEQKERMQNEFVECNANVLESVRKVSEENDVLKAQVEKLQEALKAKEDALKSLRATPLLANTGDPDVPDGSGKENRSVDSSFALRARSHRCLRSALQDTLASNYVPSTPSSSRLARELADLRARYDALVTVKERAAIRYKEDYQKWHRFKQWLFREDQDGKEVQKDMNREERRRSEAERIVKKKKRFREMVGELGDGRAGDGSVRAERVAEPQVMERPVPASDHRPRVSRDEVTRKALSSPVQHAQVPTSRKRCA